MPPNMKAKSVTSKMFRKSGISDDYSALKHALDDKGVQRVKVVYQASFPSNRDSQVMKIVGRV